MTDDRKINVWIFNYMQARDFVPTEPTLAVRIFDPGEDSTNVGGNTDQPLVASRLWLGRVTSTFADYNPLIYYENGDVEIAKDLARNPYAFTDELADKLLEDVGSHMNLRFGHTINPQIIPSALMVHCNAGVSRSPAVARAICQIFEFTPIWMGHRSFMMNNGHIGNTWVYRKLLENA